MNDVHYNSLASRGCHFTTNDELAAMKSFPRSACSGFCPTTPRLLVGQKWKRALLARQRRNKSGRLHAFLSTFFCRFPRQCVRCFKLCEHFLVETPHIDIFCSTSPTRVIKKAAFLQPREFASRATIMVCAFHR